MFRCFFNCTFLFAYNDLFAHSRMVSNIPKYFQLLMQNYMVYNRDIDIMVREFANDTGNWCSIPGRAIPKTQNDT